MQNKTRQGSDAPPCRVCATVDITVAVQIGASFSYLHPPRAHADRPWKIVLRSTCRVTVRWLTTDGAASALPAVHAPPGVTATLAELQRLARALRIALTTGNFQQHAETGESNTATDRRQAKIMRVIVASFHNERRSRFIRLSFQTKGNMDSNGTFKTVILCTTCASRYIGNLESYFSYRTACSRGPT